MMVSAMMSCHVLDAITASRQHCSRLAVSWSLTAVGRTQSSVLERSYSDIPTLLSYSLAMRGLSYLSEVLHTMTVGDMHHWLSLTTNVGSLNPGS